MPDIISIYSDGGARGNPGPAACAFLVTNGKGELIHKESKFLGNATNNFAEYQGVIMALIWLANRPKVLELGFRVNFYLDSELITRQINGIYRVKEPTLKKLFLIVKNLESKVSSKIFFKNIPREKNKLADFLLNQKLDENI